MTTKVFTLRDCSMKKISKHLIDNSLQELFHSGSGKDFVAQVRRLLQQILTRIQAQANYDQAIALLKRESFYRELNNIWDELKPSSRREKWRELSERLIQVAYSTRPYCVRCGECCRLGSPSFQLEDGDLLAKGLIATRQVYTLRRGEPVRFNIEGREGILPNELIKIKEDPEGGHCVFYQETQRGCTIYDHRPLQCRFQECWNPEGLEKLWKRRKLTRSDLLKKDQDLMELLEIHEERCDPVTLDSVFTAYRQRGNPEVLEQALDILRQDFAVRTLAVTRLKRDEDELDFLLGRSLTEIIRIYGVRVEKDEKGVYHLVSDQ